MTNEVNHTYDGEIIPQNQVILYSWKWTSHPITIQPSDSYKFSITNHHLLHTPLNTSTNISGYLMYSGIFFILTRSDPPITSNAKSSIMNHLL